MQFSNIIEKITINNTKSYFFKKKLFFNNKLNVNINYNNYAIVI